MQRVPILCAGICRLLARPARLLLLGDVVGEKHLHGGRQIVGVDDLLGFFLQVDQQVAQGGGAQRADASLDCGLRRNDIHDVGVTVKPIR